MTEQSVNASEVHHHVQHAIEFFVDGTAVTTHVHRLNGLQIRELGAKDRVDGFETQEVDEHGKKKRTIGDTEQIEIHEHERFRTVPSHGGPGATF